MPGQRTYAVFGFCILEDFIATMEVLEEEIMTYVNQVAEITHSMVDRYGGSANKNIGEAFLCVWKFHDPDEIEDMDIKNNYNNKHIGKENQIVADLSVFSFLKVIAKLNKYRHIRDYSKNEKMKQKIGHDFKVNGLRPASRMGNRGSHWLSVQGRCQLFVTECQHGSEA